MQSAVGWKIRTALGLMIAGALPLLLMWSLLAAVMWQLRTGSHGGFDAIGLMMMSIFSLVLACVVSVPAGIWLVLLHRRRQRKMSLHYTLPTVLIGLAIGMPLLYYLMLVLGLQP